MKKIILMIILTGLCAMPGGVLKLAYYVYGAPALHADLYDKGTVSVRMPDQREIDRIRTDKDFQYDTRIGGESVFDVIVTWLMKRLFSVIVSRETGIVLRVITYIIMAAAVIIAVIVLRRGDFGFGLFSRKDRQSGDVRFDSEEDIHGIDYDVIIKKNIDGGDFRPALRYRFLKTLYILSQYKIIEWRKEKTNLDYVKEVQGKIPSAAFVELVRIFEFVWYGNLNIDRDFFEQIYGQFHSFDNSIGRNE